MSPIQKAVAHILSEMERNGTETNEEVRAEVRELLKEKLVKVEQQVFHDVLTKFGGPQETSEKLQIRVYRSGAFMLHHFAPGGICEVDENNKVVAWETLRCPMCVEAGTKHSKSMCEARFQKKVRAKRLAKESIDGS